MTERPILFSAPMVRALLAGTKTQTRRVVKSQGGHHCAPWERDGRWKWLIATSGHGVSEFFLCPYGVAGDRLWVRENGWERPERSPKMMREGADTWERYYYDADISDADHAQFKEWGFRRRPSIHMPRWACRLVLQVVGVRVERLDAISEEDAQAEGVTPMFPPGAGPARHVFAFRNLWDSLNAKRGLGWNLNPWVWVVELKRA